MFAKLFSWSAVAALGAATMAVAPGAASAQAFVPGGYAEVVPGQYYGVGGRCYVDVPGGDYGRGDRYDRGYYGRGYRGGRGYYADRGYYNGGYGGGYGGRRGYYGGRGYRCDRGTGGTILGAIAGGLLGNELGQGRYGRGDGTAGAIIGGGIGALTGRAIDRNC